MGDTIVATATPPGRSARAMVRLSGPGAHAAIRALLHNDVLPRDGERRLAPCLIMLPSASPGSPLPLPALIARFNAPRSYTGEDTIELQCVGNPNVVQRLLAALTAMEGVRRAEPGEFSARAYLNGKMTLAEAEGVAAVIAADSGEQLSAARELLEGRTGERYRAWSDEAATLLALVEAGIDFTDQEDVIAIAPAALAARLEALRSSMAQHVGAKAGGEARHALPRIVLAGAPNAGKSTLFNALLGRTRAVASPAAGTTRDVLTEELDLSPDCPGAGTVLLQDVAGLESPFGDHAEKGSLADPRSSEIEHAAQHAAATAIARADLLLWCDPTSDFSGLKTPDVPLIRLRTFADQAGPNAGSADLSVCALDGYHLADLRRLVAARLRTVRSAGIAALLPRHHAALAAAYGHLSQALTDTAAAGPAQPEVTAAHLRLALDALGELSGVVSPDEVLGRVFASFCIGK